VPKINYRAGKTKKLDSMVFYNKIDRYCSDHDTICIALELWDINQTYCKVIFLCFKSYLYSLLQKKTKNKIKKEKNKTIIQLLDFPWILHILFNIHYAKMKKEKRYIFLKTVCFSIQRILLFLVFVHSTCLFPLHVKLCSYSFWFVLLFIKTNGITAWHKEILTKDVDESMERCTFFLSMFHTKQFSIYFVYICRTCFQLCFFIFLFCT